MQWATNILSIYHYKTFRPCRPVSAVPLPRWTPRRSPDRTHDPEFRSSDTERPAHTLGIPLLIPHTDWSSTEGHSGSAVKKIQQIRHRTIRNHSISFWILNIRNCITFSSIYISLQHFTSYNNQYTYKSCFIMLDYLLKFISLPANL